MRHAVVTPARNESANLCRLARSLRSQTVAPVAWIVVDTGSTDGTAELVRGLTRTDPRIRLVHCPAQGRLERGAPVVRAFQAGLAALPAVPDVIVKLDADLSFAPDYFERLLAAFEADPSLGIASGTCYEREDGRWRRRHVTGTTVWGASRAYRRSCLEALLPLEERMGWDGIDELKANALGWKTRTLPDLPFRHHRREGSRDGAVRARARQGRAARYMGYRFWYLGLRALHHARREPASLAMLAGYLAAALRREPVCADEAVRAQLRRRQRVRHLPQRAREALGHR